MEDERFLRAQWDSSRTESQLESAIYFSSTTWSSSPSSFLLFFFLVLSNLPFFYFIFFIEQLLITKPQLLNIGKEKYKLISQTDLVTICVNDGSNLPEGVGENSETFFEITKIGKKYQKNISQVFDAGDDQGSPFILVSPSWGVVVTASS